MTELCRAPRPRLPCSTCCSRSCCWWAAAARWDPLLCPALHCSQDLPRLRKADVKYVLQLLLRLVRAGAAQQGKPPGKEPNSVGEIRPAG